MLELRNVTIKAGNFKIVDLNLTIDESEYFVLLGESGAGKSLILKAISGIIPIESGEILLHGENISDIPTHKRNIGLVHQNLSLFSHLTVFENIAYSLKYKNLTKKEIEGRVEKIASDFEIHSLLEREINKLSGGEQQRVALARTLAQNPKIILLDEPLSSVDASISKEIRALLRGINRSGQTIVHVTHQYEEALSLAHNIAVIEQGKILQTGKPQEVFNNPSSRFVAHLSGLENFFAAKITDINEAQINDNISIVLHDSDVGKEGYVMFNSHDVIVSNNQINSSMTNNFHGKVIDISRNNNGVNLVVDAGFRVQALIMEKTLDTMGIAIGSCVWVHFKATAVRFI